MTPLKRQMRVDLACRLTNQYNVSVWDQSIDGLVLDLGDLLAICLEGPIIRVHSARSDSGSHVLRKRSDPVSLHD